MNECLELEDEERQLSEVFGESPPQGKKYYILVQVPKGESIHSRACGAVALMVDINAAAEQILQRLGLVLHMEDPAFKAFFLPSTSYSAWPIASYIQYWGQGEGGLLGTDNILRPEDKEALYFFRQYEYMVKRIDLFRKKNQDLLRTGNFLAIGLPGVLIMGTPGIGESPWPLYPGEGLTAFLIGKTSFLKYYLARELARKKPVIYVTGEGCYIFKDGSVYVSETVPRFGDGFLHILCLVDADVRTPAPDHLLNGSYPFLLMASSPRKAHYTTWIKQRASGRSPMFVLNPPGDDELIKASV